MSDKNLKKVLPKFINRLIANNQSLLAIKYLLNFVFIKEKTFVIGVRDLIGDYKLILDQNISNEENRSAMELLLSSLEKVSHIISQDHEQIAPQLYGRLNMSESIIIKQFLTTICLDNTWLKPNNISIDRLDNKLARKIQWKSNIDQDYRLVYENRSKVEMLPDMKSLIVADYHDQTLITWDIWSGEKVNQFKLNKGVRFSAFCLIPDEDIAIISNTHFNDDNIEVSSIFLFDVKRSIILKYIAPSSGIIFTEFYFLQKSKLIASLSQNTIYFFDIDGEIWKLFDYNTHQITDHDIFPISKFVIAEDEKTLYIQTSNYATLWEFETLKLKDKFHTSSIVEHTDFNIRLNNADSDSMILFEDKFLVSSNSKNIFIWDLEKKEKIRTLSKEEGVPIAFFDATTLLLFKDKKIITLNFLEGTLRALLNITESDLSEIIRIEDKLITKHNNGFIDIWDLSEKKANRKSESLYEGVVKDIQIINQNNDFIFRGYDKSIFLWNYRDKKIRFILKGHNKIISKFTILPCRKLCMSASEDGQMILWDIVYGTIKDTFSFHEDKVCDFQITPDGKICISASNNEIIIWRLLENEVIARLQNNENLYNDTSLAIHPNGKHFYTSHDYGRIRFWDLENLSRPISETETEYNEADYKYRLEVTSDGRFLLCIKDNSSFKIINLGNDNVYTNHRSLITDKYSTIYNPNNEQFISSSENGSVNIYNNKNEWVKYENEIKGLLCDVSSDMKSALFVRKDVLFVADLTKLRVVAKYYGDRVFTSAKLSLNQKEIIAGNDNGEVHFFSIENI